ncbi:heparin sulfate O-sulfotransferase-like [Schistocerca cancellata]|uniref:heparin sulfate O-sulfotransferase-like n=1 Tax=Schistocerca cancellata TaxID=274614 RepID=UPI002118C585|nr:heparin sulfate O-sulfotransferase-like [Schistocerca cancellata]
MQRMIQRVTVGRVLLFGALLSFVIFVLLFESQILQVRESTKDLEYLVASLHQRNVENHRIFDNRPEESMLTDMVIIYNRVPKTASTSFVGVAYELCKQNGFHVLHINITANMHVLTLANQLQFVQNISYWNSIKPAFYHGHMAFLDFGRFGVSQRPLYINLIRKPLDRLVSYYYFLRYGDDFRPHLVRRKHGDKKTFDECVQLNQPDCDPDNMWLQIPFFCGHAAPCWIPGNEWALEEAKRNLINHYFLVGVTEELADFVKILEVALPNFFRGAAAHFETSKKSHLRKTAQKIEPSEETVSIIKQSKVWKMENELYEFALEQFHYIKKKILAIKDSSNSEKVQQFTYEKIRPK